ncbi:helix-turn-helix transcriptional regulator [Saccharothrix sp. 6-C]|uniref:helix-turn-helix domain-containing protein n=1 Tax=Saccharothrix sp. 6-C TaxID=2781735 RepID=UPI0019171E52|nr:AraC family transcriptional regulator [Saccharothrix sp. 6-C]QQQ75546.1 helix-turn-helix transcriptional regulator [Saccharothrix sp. 6-C]
MEERLRPWVAGIGTQSFGGGKFVHAPDTATTLVVCTASSGAFVVGPRDRARYTTGREDARRTVVRLTPGRAQAVLDVPVDELVGQVVPLSEVWGRPVGDVAALRSALLSRLESTDPSRSDLVHAAARLLRTRGVAETARALDVSERHLRTLFTKAVGLSPKQYARVDRVRRVVARGERGGWARLAVELGYYDQAHLSREFRATMGVPPGAYAAGNLPAATYC